MKSDRSVVIALLFLLVVSLQATSQELKAVRKKLSREQAQALILDSERQIESILQKEIHLPGLAIALVSRDEVLWAKAFGYRDAARREKADADTLYGLLSLSKTVTVTGLMAAVQEGLLDLDVPIKSYLPGFRINSRSPEDPMAAITVRHLLSMTSGLTHDAPVGNNADPACPSYKDHIQSISRTWLRFRTGERAEYSNLGIELAAYILETVTHKPFTDYIQKKVFNPLGMSRSTWDIDVIRRDGNRTIGHNKNFACVPLENPMLAPGAAYSSIRDMATFLQFHLNDGRLRGSPLIHEQTLRQMRAIPFPIKDQVAGYGMGLWVGAYHLGDQDVRWLAHGGGGFGYRCQMKWLPDLGYGAVVLTNSQDHDNVNENLVEGILLKVVELLTGKKDLGPADWLSRHALSQVSDPSKLPVELTGRYNGTNDDMLFLVMDGRFGYASGNTFVPVTPVSRYEFAAKRYLYRFVCDATGKAISVARPYDGTVWILGAGSNDPQGPEKKEWTGFLGSYLRKRFGVGERFYSVSLKNGWLHFQGDGQDFRLSEHSPGLFFTPDGEAVDLRGPSPSFRNIRLYKCSN
jgi:CubicO group peptidase (beta-lactamase class C family)